MILFLEFEWVLFQGTWYTADGGIVHDECLAQLERLLIPYADRLEIVISDQRLLRSPLDALRNLLPPRVATMVIDSMYLAELSDSSWSDYHSALATRYACLKLWLERRRPHCQAWIALQGGRQLDSWPPSERHHLVHGLLSDPAVRLRLTRQLREQLGDERRPN